MYLNIKSDTFILPKATKNIFNLLCKAKKLIKQRFDNNKQLI